MQYLIDVGSLTIKVYERRNNTVSLIIAKTFAFKEGFEPSIGLSESSKTSLYTFFEELSARFSLTRSNTRLYATGIFRNIVNKQIFVEEFYIRTGLYFNIISHNLEAFYLEKAWVGKFTGMGNLLIINIGGGTTELLFYNRGIKIKSHKIDELGVSTIKDNNKYKAINDKYSFFPIEEIIELVKKRLPKVEGKFDTAIYTGGELTYMQIAGYALQQNTIFSDRKHPSMINLKDYCEQNQRVFKEITISDLRNMMPNNTCWMDGARACSAIAQAICNQYGVEMIIPSDSNLIDGVNIQEVRSVVTCGNLDKQSKRISRLILKLEAQGISVLNRNNLSLANDKAYYLALAQSIRTQIRPTVAINSDISTSYKSISAVICGSFNKHLEHITQLIKELKKQDIIILSPNNTDVVYPSI